MRKIMAPVGAFFVALATAFGASAQSNSTVHALGTNATSPLAAGSCIYVDQSPGSDTKLCSGWAAAFGAVPLNGNAGTPSSINLGNATNVPASALAGIVGTSSGGAGSVTGILKANGSGVVSNAVNGADFTKITTKTCTGTDKVSALTAGGEVTCTPDANGSAAGASGDWQKNNTGAFGSFTPGAGVESWVTDPTSAKLLAALTTKTGTGLAVFGTAPTIASPTIAAIANLTSNGLLKTSGGVGTLGVAAAGTDYAAAPGGGANTPLFNNGAGGFTNGTRSGNSTVVVTKDASTPAANDCAKWDVNGNLTTAGSGCGGGGGSVVATDGAVSVSPASTMSFASGFKVTDAGAGTATIAETVTKNAQAGASYTIQATDAGKEIIMTNGSATTVTMMDLATAGDGYGTGITCVAGCTINRSGSDLLNGATSVTLGPNTSAWIRSDGTTAGRVTVTSPKDPLVASNMASGTLTSARLPGAPYANGKLLIGKTDGTLAANTITAGANVTVTNGDGTITIASSGGGGTGCTTAGSSGQVLADNGGGGCNSLASLTDNGSRLTATHSLALSGITTPTALSGNVNDWNPTGLGTNVLLRTDGGAADRTITGITAQASGTIVGVKNIGTTNSLIFTNADAGSSASNRFDMSGNVTVAPGGVRFFQYDGTGSRWISFGAAVADTGVTAGSYTNANITVGKDGRVSSAANGSGSGSSQILFTSASGGTITTTNIYFGQRANATAVGSLPITISATSRTLSNLTCRVGTAAGAGNSYDFTLNVNGSDNTNQKVNIAGATDLKTSTVTANTPVVVSRDDYVTMKTTWNGVSSSTTAQCTMDMQ